MKSNSVAWLLPLALLAGPFRQNPSVQSVPISIIVSVEALKGSAIPDVAAQDVQVFKNNEPVQVKGWSRVREGPGGLQLFVVVDDSVISAIELQLQEVRKLIMEQPSTAAVAIGYIRGNAIDTVQEFTSDHARAAQVLRSPYGTPSTNLNPYMAVASLLDRWSAGSAAREILLISGGINRMSEGPNDSSLDAVIAAAQRAAVQIYCVAAPPAGHLGHSLRVNSLAQLKLSELADETGGETYAQAFDLQMNSLGDRLAHQYRLTFLAQPAPDAQYESLKLETRTPNAELVAATKVYVPGLR